MRQTESRQQEQTKMFFQLALTRLMAYFVGNKQDDDKDNNTKTPSV
jgi:hypothetical protein